MIWLYLLGYFFIGFVCMTTWRYFEDDEPIVDFLFFLFWPVVVPAFLLVALFIALCKLVDAASGAIADGLHREGLAYFSNLYRRLKRSLIKKDV